MSRAMPLVLFATLGVVLALAVVGTAAVGQDVAAKSSATSSQLDRLTAEQSRLEAELARLRAANHNLRRYARKLERRNAHLARELRHLRARLRAVCALAGRLCVAQASYYGPGLYGRGTACGQTLEPSSSWVAHRTLPCGTRLLICVARCERTFVGDRGPYVAGRDFDLAPGLKAAIGFGSTGPVRWRLL